jgi:hypothetical protein
MTISIQSMNDGRMASDTWICTFIYYSSEHELTFSTQVSPIVPFGMYRENSERNTATINNYSDITQSLINQEFYHRDFC